MTSYMAIWEAADRRWSSGGEAFSHWTRQRSRRSALVSYRLLVVSLELHCCAACIISAPVIFWPAKRVAAAGLSWQRQLACRLSGKLAHELAIRLTHSLVCRTRSARPAPVKTRSGRQLHAAVCR